MVVGVLAGLINDHPRHRGHFDDWLEAPDGGKSLNLGKLNLVGKREHILDTAIQALPPKALQLLQTLALLQRGADYELLLALNPHLQPEPKEPADPETGRTWRIMNRGRRAEEKAKYEKARADYR